MSIPLDQEIRILRSLFWSDRDPEGRAFVPLADAYRRSGEFRKAIELLNDGLERHPEFASAHAVAARLYLEKGLVEEAEIAARRVLRLDEDNVLGLELLAGALEQRGIAAEAASVRSHLADLSGRRPAEAPTVEEAEEILAVADLAPEEAVGEEEEEVVDLADLAPEPEEAEEVMDLAALAPDEAASEEEVVLDLAALAPEEEVVDLSALAPYEPPVEEEEAVVDLADLAPEPEEAEEVMDLATLAPDEGVVEEDVVIDLSELAPFEPTAADEDVVELVDLAPAASPEDEEIFDLGTLVPTPTVDEPWPDDDELADLAALAPEVPDEPIPEAASLLPEEPVVDLDELAPAPGWRTPEESGIVIFASDAGVSSGDVLLDEPLPSDELPAEPLVVTRTMAELYARQGLTERALEVFRQLLEATPGDQGLRRRIAELEAAEARERFAPRPRREDLAGIPEEDEGVVGTAWDVQAQQERHEVDTPFAWTQEEAEEAPPAAGPAIGRYFERLLAWEPEGGWDDDLEAEDEADGAGPDGPDV